MLKYIVAAAALFSSLYVFGCGEGNCFSKQEYIVGKDIAINDIKDFYYTIDVKKKHKGPDMALYVREESIIGEMYDLYTLGKSCF